MMTGDSSIAAMLGRLDLFSAVKSSTLDHLAEYACDRTFPKGTTLFRQGAVPRYLHVPRSGKLALVSTTQHGEKAIIDLKTQGEPVAASSALLGEPYQVTAEVLEEASVVLLPAAAVLQAAQHDPTLSLALLRSLAREHRRVVGHVKALKTERAVERCSRFLLNLIDAQKSPRIVLPFSKKLIAEFLGMTPATLSRSLTELRRQGIETRGKELRVDDKAPLERLLEGPAKSAQRPGGPHEKECEGAGV